MSQPQSTGALSLAVAARTLALGAAGGWLFSIGGLPLPWLTGPIAVIAALAIAGVSVDMPDWFRPVIFIMLGIIIGSRVDQQMLAGLARWPLSLGLLVLYVPAAIATMYAYFRLVGRADPNTALVSSSPGSLTYVLAYAADSGADMRKVVVTQSVRLGILVLLLPMALTQAAPPPGPAIVATFNPFDQIWLFAAAAAGGALVPMLTLGVPGSGTTAVLLALLMTLNITPGPMLFVERPDVVWGLIATLIIANVVLLILNVPLVGIFVRLLSVPPQVLLPAVTMISFVGIYSLSGSSFDLMMMIAFGILGYALRKLGVPTVPIILGILLGNHMEDNLRRAMVISGGDWRILFSSSLAIGLWIAAIGGFVAPMFLRRFLRKPTPD